MFKRYKEINSDQLLDNWPKKLVELIFKGLTNDQTISKK